MSATFVNATPQAWFAFSGATFKACDNSTATTAGNFLVCITRVTAAGTLYNVSAVTSNGSPADGLSLGARLTGVAGEITEIWYGVAQSTNTIQFTVAWGGANDNGEIDILQYSGFTAAGSPIDVAALTSAGGGGTSMTSASFSTAQANELAIVKLSGTTPFSAGTGYTERTDHNYSGTQDKSFTAIQSGITADMNCGGSAGPILVVTIKDNDAGSSGTVGGLNGGKLAGKSILFGRLT
jgi:hypothetical protein